MPLGFRGRQMLRWLPGVRGATSETLTTTSSPGSAAGNGTHGNQVLINHGVLDGRSTVTVYNHLSRFAVSYGEQVSRGEVIGYTGATGNTTGCHVHFELWFNGAPVNPMSYL